MGIFWIYMTRPIVSQKTSVAKAEGWLSKSFGIGRLCLASVIVCNLDTIQNECVGQISKLYLINLANMPAPYTKPPFSHFKTFQSWVACNPSTYASQFSSYSPKSGSPWPSLKQKDHKSSSASVRQDKKIIREIAFQKLMIWAQS